MSTAESPESEITPKPSWRSWLRFRLRTLLFVLTIIGVFFAWLGYQYRQAERQRQAVKRSGGSAYYDFEIESISPPVFVTKRDAPLPGWNWTRKLLGIDFHADVKVMTLSSIVTPEDGLKHLRNLTELEYLEFSGSEFGPPVLIHLRELTQLRVLELNGIPISDTEMVNLEELIRLESLTLSSHLLSSDGLAHLRSLKHLKHLRITSTQVSDDGLKHLGPLKELERLSLHSTKVTDSGLTYLRELPKLKELNLTYTRITDDGVAHLATMQQLEKLGLEGTSVTANGILKLKTAIPECRIYWRERWWGHSYDPDPREWKGWPRIH